MMSPSNGLAPQQGPAPSIGDQQAQAQAQFSQLSKAQSRLSAIQQGLAPLAALGQKVTRNDVFEEMIKLMQGGSVTAGEAAKELGEMPQEGPALADWVQNQAAKHSQQAQQLAPLHEQARDKLGATSLALMAQHLGNSYGPKQAPDGEFYSPDPARPGKYLHVGQQNG